MAVFRVNKNNSYTTICNSVLKDKELSLEAKGLLITMLSLPKDWDYTINGLSIITNEKCSKITKLVKELIDNGYIIRTKLKPCTENGGKISYIYDIYEEKSTLKNQGVENQGVENQGVEVQGVEKYHLNKINNNKINNNKINNNKINNNIYIVEVVKYLNLKAHTNYKDSTPKTKTLIQARLNEGFTPEDFKIVIDKKCAEWLGTDMQKYLRPETLFGTKFEGYLNQIESIDKVITNSKQFEDFIERGIV